jgi:hypothetical protein
MLVTVPTVLIHCHHTHHCTRAQKSSESLDKESLEEKIKQSTLREAEAIRVAHDVLEGEHYSDLAVNRQ